MALVYALVRDDEVVYIGRTKDEYNLKQRLYSHRTNGKIFDSYVFHQVESGEIAKQEERRLIKNIVPEYNRQCIPGRIRYGPRRYGYRR